MPLGSDNGYCIRTLPHDTWECQYSVSLFEGGIIVQGSIRDGANVSSLAIVGGTKGYAGTYDSDEYDEYRGTNLIHFIKEKTLSRVL